MNPFDTPTQLSYFMLLRFELDKIFINNNHMNTMLHELKISNFKYSRLMMKWSLEMKIVLAESYKSIIQKIINDTIETVKSKVMGGKIQNKLEKLKKIDQNEIKNNLKEKLEKNKDKIENKLKKLLN